MLLADLLTWLKQQPEIFSVVRHSRAKKDKGFYIVYVTLTSGHTGHRLASNVPANVKLQLSRLCKSIKGTSLDLLENVSPKPPEPPQRVNALTVWLDDWFDF